MVVVALFVGAYAVGGVVTILINPNEVKGIPTGCEQNTCNVMDPCLSLPNGNSVRGMCSSYGVLGQAPADTNCIYDFVYGKGEEGCIQSDCTVE